MKLLDNMIGPVKRPPRKSWLTLSRSNRFLVDIISTEWFDDLKRKRPEALKGWGLEEEKYHDWLRRRNCQDNMTNMLLWLHSASKKTT
jgi:hypothetical protein